MTQEELANIMYPDVTHDIDYYEKMYPERNLPEGAVVSRYAPSPTGECHMGSLFSSFIDQFVAKTTNGIFYFRVEDTDKKREVPGCMSRQLRDLKQFDIIPMEGIVAASEDGVYTEAGEYGPYVQSKRLDIYHTYAKWLVIHDYAYPAFETPEELDIMRKNQEARKARIGYYGAFAKYRDVSNDEKAKLIKEGRPWVLRFKSHGNYNRKVEVNDLVRGKITFPENDMDQVLIKENGIPVYHFAHVIDDHLMHTTFVMRGEEWFPSVPLHIELFKAFGFKMPKYAHTSVIMKIDETTGNRRKLSKRLDPEARMEYYHEMGVPTNAVHEYLMTLANSNFEGWRDQNPNADIYEYKFDFKKMSLSGSLFDLEKLKNISRKYIASLTAEEVYNNTIKYYDEFDKDFSELIKKYKDYTINILNIEREQKKPRKDYAYWSDIKNGISYMYDELFTNITYNWDKINNIDEIKDILNKYISVYDDNDDKDTWFNKIKELTNSLEGYTSDMKEYKLNPDNYKGNVSDVSTVIRIALTGRDKTPDLYEIMKLLGNKRIKERFNKIN